MPLFGRNAVDFPASELNPCSVSSEGAQAMRLRIHRGAKEIGGTCIEVEAAGKRLVLDAGLPLDAPDHQPPRPIASLPTPPNMPSLPCSSLSLHKSDT